MMNPKSLVLGWLRKLPVLFGLVCYLVLVWFAGPLLAIGDSRPLEGVGIRILLVAIGIVAVALFYLIVWWRRRRAERAIEAALVEGDEPVLKQRMSEALATLKRSGGRQTFLYELPWYVIIGPPGTGKTTALVNSGLNFPLAGKGGAEAVAGLGGTRYLDFWFTDDAVLIDTAGRYTTQDSDADTDRRGWLAFLGLLKENRPKQPINGVLLAISLEELLTLPQDQLAAHAEASRKRLQELNAELKIDFPVYALFTKADLVEGFREYFASFPEQRRRRVWGATFPGDDRRKNHVAAVPGEFDALVRRLTEEMPDRLQEEPDPVARIAIFGFPAQFAGLRDKIAAYLNLVFEPNRYQANVSLRGFYFSSGTQEGTPIDQLLGTIGRDFSVEVGRGHLSGFGKSFFLRDLLEKVVFAESGWVSVDRAAIRRATALRYGALGLLGIVTLALLGLWGWSYASNKALIEATGNAVDDYRVAAGDELTRTEIDGSKPIDGNELATIARLLAGFAANPTGYANPDKSVPASEGFGLSQREGIAAASEVSYRNALERMLRARLIIRLEQQIADRLNDPNAVYEALKVYLMLGGGAPKVDDDYVTAWMEQDWETNLLPGKANEQARRQLTDSLRAMLALGRSHQPTFQLNDSLVTEAQAALARMKLADRAYLLIKSSAYAAGLRDFSIAAVSGSDAARVFETRDGSDIARLTIPGLFTYEGFNSFFFPQLEAVANKLESEHWVMGDAGQQSGVEQQFSQLGPALVSMYSDDFVATWEKALADLRLKSIIDDKPDYQVLAAASSAVTSPIRLLLEAIRAETALTEQRAPPEGAAKDANGNPASPPPAAADASKGLQRIGIDIALGKSQARAGTATSAVAAPGQAVEDHFKPYYVWVDGQPGARPVDLLLKNLDDVRQSLVVIASYPSQAEEATRQLGVQVATLRGNLTRLPKPFQLMIAGAVEAIEGAEAGSSRAQINQDLAVVTRACQRIVGGRYPFERGASADAPIPEFVQVFGPNGLMDKFFGEHVAGMVDMSGDAWAWRKDDRAAQQLSPDTLRQFQRASDIRNAFFPDGGTLPNVQITIAPASTSPGTESTLEINQAVISTAVAGNPAQTITWPGNGGPGSANLSLFPELPGRDNRIGAQGPWALMRLLDAGLVARKGDGLLVRFAIGGREASYGIRVGSSYNPLFLPALADFKCPTGF